jgi:beta-glucosidase
MRNTRGRRPIAREDVELSQRLAAESVTLLKNEKGLLPLSLDIKTVAVIGAHADSTAAGFPGYTYPAGAADAGGQIGRRRDLGGRSGRDRKGSFRLKGAPPTTC